MILQLLETLKIFEGTKAAIRKGQNKNKQEGNSFICLCSLTWIYF